MPFLKAAIPLTDDVQMSTDFLFPTRLYGLHFKKSICRGTIIQNATQLPIYKKHHETIISVLK